ncbi:MAG: integrase [Pseudomonadota bacterium]
MSVRVKQTQITWPSVRDLTARAPESRAAPRLATVPIHHYRDGDVVVYARPGSAVWQCRCKLAGGRWLRLSTRQRNLQDAARRACELYDEMRFRERLGLAPQRRRFRDIAQATLEQLRTELASGSAKSIYRDYCAAIERYFLPFFGNRFMDQTTHQVVAQFEQWRNSQLKRAPAHSTLLTYAAAWQRVQQTALERGWITAGNATPRLNVRGRQSQARPAFSAEEIQQLRDIVAVWCAQPTRRAKEAELRSLLRDYLEALLFTGMRHGTEAMRVEWRHWELYQDPAGVQYLRLQVSGKTGPRWLIAKHDIRYVLERLAQRDPACQGQGWPDAITQRLPHRVFRYTPGEQPHNFNAVFRRLLTDAGLLKDGMARTRTLYSLRHTYATMELLAGTDIHTLARQMGTSVVMLERHYSKLTPTLAAGQLAGG